MISIQQIHRIQNGLSFFWMEFALLQMRRLRDRNLIKSYFIKRAIPATGLKTSEKTNFLSKNANEICLIIQEKQSGNDPKRFYDEIVVLFDVLLD